MLLTTPITLTVLELQSSPSTIKTVFEMIFQIGTEQIIIKQRCQPYVNIR